MDKHSASTKGALYVVATPIGNLEDITQRAINILKSVDAIIAEDTRHSGQLCSALGIKKPLHSLHAHNENDKSSQFIDALIKGQSFALISDAGTPLISDPGFILVRLAQENGIPVIPIPGCCAFIAALSIAGIPCDNFTFSGFLPAKSLPRKEKLLDFKKSMHTNVVYESTHRIKACLEDVIEIFGEDYELVLAKELTKNFERLIHEKAAAIKAWLEEESAHVKGEFVLIFPAVLDKKSFESEDEVLAILLKELPLKQAVKLASAITKVSKNVLYKRALETQSF
jgi:16S rRNA (cytidine1402-2'-O)-methyltransferase